MAPDTRLKTAVGTGGSKKGGEVEKEKKPARKSVDGDGCWDVSSNELLDCFEFVGKKGAQVRAGEGGSEAVVLRPKFAGQWRSIIGEQCFMNGVHYLAIRVEGHSRNDLPNSEIHSSWFVGVGSRKCPLDGDLSELAYIERSVLGGFVPVGLTTGGVPKTWALGFSNYIAQPFGPGKVIVLPASALRTPLQHGGGGGLSQEPVALLPHGARLQHGDVLGIRIDVDAATVGFFVNKKHMKDVHLSVDCASWVALASSSDPCVKFSLLSQDEQREAKLWDRAARQEIEESVAAGSKVLGSAGRQAEGQALAEALASGHVHQAEQLLLWGVEPADRFLNSLSPQGIIQASAFLLLYCLTPYALCLMPYALCLMPSAFLLL